MCDCFYLHGQTGDRDAVSTNVFEYSPSILLCCDPPTRLDPCDCVVGVDHEVMWLAIGEDEHLFVLLFCLFQLAYHGSASLGYLAAESRSRA